jgi:hypothetical protein
MLSAPARYSAGTLALAKAIASILIGAKQRRHIASLRRVLTSRPDGLSAAADKTKRSPFQWSVI